MQIETPDSFSIPKPATNAERQKRYRAESTDKYYAMRKKYRHDNSKHQTDAEYLSRHFTAWDGEGVTIDGEHLYVMLAVKSGDGFSDYLGNPRGLGTAQVFDFVLSCVGRMGGDNIHVIYGGGYDFNMWLRDLSKAELKDVYESKFSKWQGYRVAWRRGKSFYLCRLNTFGQKIGKGVTIYDVVSFFQSPFVAACDSYLGDKFTHREMIVENKALRSSFTVDDIPDVRRYNDAELDNLIALMVELRSRLNKVNLRPRRWDGPGAVASALLLREGVKDSMTKELPPEVSAAARYAYAGGRFEVIKFGHVERQAYEYDVNSAYPSALREVPNLAYGEWKHTNGDPGDKAYCLYHVRSVAYRDDIPSPLFRRDANGTICYPLMVTGWYWSPEIKVLRRYAAMGLGEYEVIEAWHFETAADNKPFSFIEPLYNKRRALKKAGDGAHVGIKLALNSLYGKLAQQVGWEYKADGSLRTPPFHQLEWAGYTTSHCRAAVLGAALSNIDSVIAFETDAVFTSEPLDIPMGSALGEFEYTEFASLTYVQSGMYFGVKRDPKTGALEDVNKTRGIDRGSVTRSDVLEGMRKVKAQDRSVIAKLTRFVGAGIALAQNFDRWRRWETVEKRMTLEPTGKRVHIECDSCTGEGIAFGEWHYTLCPMFNDAHSAEFPIEWINPNPEMRYLDELRNSPNYE